jgi:cell division septum initiation protein DivIVA
MTNEEYESAVARADDFLDTLKDTCHDQYDKIKELQDRIDKAIEYIKEHTNNGMFELRTDTGEIEELLNILQGVENE